jgi:predicted acetyltransferase
MNVDTAPLRPATPDDVPGLADLWALAFPGERTAQGARGSPSRWRPWGGWENAWVAGSDGRIDGAARALPLTMHLFGRPVPTLGVAAVAVAPHARRRGLGSAMTRAVLRIGRARGDLLSALYPFRSEFYARLGFGLAGEFHRYRFPPEALPLFPGFERVERLASPLDVLPDLHQALTPLSHGLFTRSPKRWEVLLAGSPIAFGVRSEGGEGWSGYLVGQIGRLPRGAGLGFRVTELLATDADAYRAALGWISAQRDAWREVTYDALPGERFEQVLAHPRIPGTRMARDLWFHSATVLRGPMVRILDAAGLLEVLEAEPGTALAIADEELPENAGRWEVGSGARPHRREDASAGDAGVLPVALASTLLVRGELPGLLLPRPGFHPPMGIGDLRILDAF